MIEQLSTQVANGIAAGEVVERPASVVKELVENALDASANRIQVEIEQGGIRLIRVVDNGFGMSEEDAQKCFLPHATSKLKTLDDLNTLQTMGFRGEALASIAAVSRVQLETRRKEAPLGIRLCGEAGQFSKPEKCGLPVGTSLTCENLFFNTPARYKFLKRDTAEGAAVEDLLQKMAFTHPEVSFRLKRNGKETLLTPGNNDLKAVLYRVWGRDSALLALPIHWSVDQMECQGLIVRSERSRKNRSHQVFIVNGRVIQSQLLRSAVEQATQGFFVKGTYPELVLRLSIPPEWVDVNVHPQKTEVRFADEKAVGRVAYYAVRSTLESATGMTVDQSQNSILAPSENPTAPISIGFPANSTDTGSEEKLPNDHSQEHKGDLTDGHRPTPTTEKRGKVETQFANYASATVFTPLSGQTRPSRATTAKGDWGEINSNLKSDLPVFSPLTVADDSAHFDNSRDEIRRTNESTNPTYIQTSFLKSQEQDSLSISSDERKDIQRLLSARLIGQLFDTYILMESGNDFLLIDQHAAHERILYERLLNDYRLHKGSPCSSQILIEPLPVQVTAVEWEQLSQQQEQDFFAQLGFEYDLFSNETVLLRAVPQQAMDWVESPESLFLNAIQTLSFELLKPDKQPGEAEMEEKLHTVACKAAVKGHDHLSEFEIQALLQQLQNLQDPFHCPHGRPVILSVSKQEIEKKFLRIV